MIGLDIYFNKWISIGADADAPVSLPPAPQAAAIPADVSAAIGHAAPMRQLYNSRAAARLRFVPTAHLGIHFREKANRRRRGCQVSPQRQEVSTMGLRPRAACTPADPGGLSAVHEPKRCANEIALGLAMLSGVLATLRWFVPAILPAVLFAMLVRRTDERREPPWLVATTFVLGSLAGVVRPLLVGRRRRLTGLDVRVSAAGESGALVFLFFVVAPAQEAAKVAAAWPAFRPEALRRALRRGRLRRRRRPRLRRRRELLRPPRAPHGRHLDRAGAPRAARARLLRLPLGIRPRTRQALEGARPDLPRRLRRDDRRSRPLRALRLRPRPRGAARGDAAARRDGVRRLDARARPAQRGTGPRASRRARASRASRAGAVPRASPPYAIPARRADEPVKVRWVFFGSLVTIGAMIVGLGGRRPRGAPAPHRPARRSTSTTWAPPPRCSSSASGLLASFPTSGWLIARAAGTHTLLEPALASVLALVITLDRLGFAAPFTVVFALALLSHRLGLACAGAWVGRVAELTFGFR